MIIGKTAHNHSDKSIQQESQNEAIVHAKPVNRQNADSVGVQIVYADSLGSTQNIEHYNNYSKDGVLNDIIDSKLEPQSVSPAAPESESTEPQFDLRAIPETREVGWLTQSLRPNWSLIPHRGMTTLSKGEIKEHIKALGEKFRNTSCENERGRLQNQARTLKMYYLSHGSPDISFRKNLLEQAMRTIRRHTGGGDGGEENSTIPRTLLDYLLKHEGKGMVFDKPYPMDGGGTVTAVATVGPNSGVAFEVHYQGQHLISLTVGVPPSVSFIQTQQEIELHEEISAIWFRAIGNP
jgi:hypothetical protein